MTQTNIDIMDRIVDILATGCKFSEALSKVYNRRHVMIPYSVSVFDIEIQKLKLDVRIVNALRRAGLHTLNAVIEYGDLHKFTEIKGVGQNAAFTLFEAILDFCWENMTNKERTHFLIETVERNECNICIRN